MFNITDLVDPAWCRFSTRDESERRPVVQDLPEHLFPLGSDRSKVRLADFRRFAGCRRSGRARRNRLPRPVRCLLLMLAPPGTPSAPPACLITRPGNQHRFRFGTHSPASFPLFSGRVGGVVTEPLPPQSRACAIDALGSSPDRFAQEALMLPRLFGYPLLFRVRVGGTQSVLQRFPSVVLYR